MGIAATSCADSEAVVPTIPRGTPVPLVEQEINAAHLRSKVDVDPHVVADPSYPCFLTGVTGTSPVAGTRVPENTIVTLYVCPKSR